MLLTHPITGRKVLYCQPGYTMRIDGMQRAESDAMLDDLFAHQLQPKYRYTHRWTEGDVLLWDHLRHDPSRDRGLRARTSIRLMRRCQVMATKVFDPAFLRPVRELA